MDENWQQCFEQGNCHEFCATRNCNARGGDGPIVEVPCKSTEGLCDIPFIWEGKTYYTFASVWNGYWCPIAVQRSRIKDFCYIQGNMCPLLDKNLKSAYQDRLQDYY